MKWKAYDPVTEPRLQWHRWFAWHPVRLENNRKVWLEFVQRKQRRANIYDTYGDMIFDRIMGTVDYEYKLEE